MEGGHMMGQDADTRKGDRPRSSAGLRSMSAMMQHPAHRNQGLTLVDLLDLVARKSGQRGYTFLADGETESARLSFQQLDQRARALAALLREQAALGDRALLLYPPGLDFLTGLFGCLY